MSNQETINIAVAGPRGKMGKEALQMIAKTGHFRCVAAIDRKNEGKRIKELEGFPDLDTPIYTDIDQCFSEHPVDVLIDFTHPEAGKYHVEKAIAYGVRPVVGTSGFSEADVEHLSSLAEEKGVGTIIAPNFAIGAVLMMKFSQMAARHFPDVEIIELHHDQKRDAPSGTAVKTAEMIQQTRKEKKQGHPEEKELIKGARGADFDGFRIHSVRLPGLIAHQQVLFGGEGELLTLRHDSMNRESFMHGVRVAVETVMDLKTLVYGLENILE
ncbi:4-hydroxy-tetrahydrodipicolinate reductase [Pullulanibacillus camelliae]|uniref:4-hydroxy-tetrahydrodipicolinate reductase n=1 Tax=Pullulanibacillus camelliae TaxID=1707096 RepID=A0A8J2VUN6_9BACL|nr:4-hydroxy-tetrahydrodipicolinate reductase [Pullulanibacillus camelliae]GGE38956.1 4-hydroxy-tetrahydrodipicolinate reductase [Pullulanibacillus camelliae]